MTSGLPPIPRTDDGDQLRFFELLHGAWLASSFFEQVLKSANAVEDRPDLLQKYPELAEAAKATQQSLADFYMIVGNHFNYDLKPGGEAEPSDDG